MEVAYYYFCVSELLVFTVMTSCGDASFCPACVTRIYFAFLDLLCVVGGQEVFRSDPQAQSFVLSLYEPVWSHMDRFQRTTQDFSSIFGVDGANG